MENNSLRFYKSRNYNLYSGISIIVFILISLISSIVNGQELQFYCIKESVTSSTELLKDKNADINRLNNLLTSINTTIYFSDGNKHVNGAGVPVVVDTDVKSLNNLYSENTDFNQVEIIKINFNSVSELNTNINADNLRSFYRLKYILADFSFDVCGNQSVECLNSKMQNIIKCDDCNIIILSRLSIPN